MSWKPKLIKSFFTSAACLLLLTAIAKIISSFGSSHILQRTDPIFGISFRILFVFVGLLELLIAFICFLNQSAIFRAALVAWLATAFCFYRLGLLWIGYARPCSCLGNLTDLLPISPQIADALMKCILFYFILGSYSTLFLLWRFRAKVGSRYVPEDNGC